MLYLLKVFFPFHKFNILLNKLYYILQINKLKILLSLWDYNILSIILVYSLKKYIVRNFLIQF